MHFFLKTISFFCFACFGLQSLAAGQSKQGHQILVSKGPEAQLKTSEIQQRSRPTQDQVNLRNQAMAKKYSISQSFRNKTNKLPSSTISKELKNNFDRYAQAKDFSLRPNFLGGTLADAEAVSGFNVYPPDSDGYVGTKQYIVCVNELIRSFNKNGKADGVLNISTDSFFASILTKIPGALTYASDPRIIFDKCTNRWFIAMVDVSIDENTGNLFPNNKILLAVSDGKRDGKIAKDTVWSFYSFHPGAITPASDWLSSGYLADAPSLGIDANALYIGNNVFSAPAENFLTADLFVINKEALLKRKDLKVTPFRDLINLSTESGMYAPEGVTNFDEDAKDGFFIGVDASSFDTLHLRRIIRPGSDSPSMSTDIKIKIPLTQYPLSVPAKGSSYPLDGGDNRVQQSHIRDKKLYTSQTIAVNRFGNSKSSVDRNGCRWYEICLKNPNRPKLSQHGTLHDRATTPNPLFYFYPSVMTNKHHTMILGCTVAGEDSFLNAAVSYRDADDAKGTLHKVKTYTRSSTAYNAPLFGLDVYRWGDYSISSPDPENSSLWTIQEFCNDTNSWGCQVVRLHKKHDK